MADHDDGAGGMCIARDPCQRDEDGPDAYVVHGRVAQKTKLYDSENTVMSWS